MTLRHFRTVLLHGISRETYPEMERANAESYLRKNGLPPGWEDIWQPTREEALACSKEKMK